jgi:hypothetical protein
MITAPRVNPSRDPYEKTDLDKKIEKAFMPALVVGTLAWLIWRNRVA